MLYNTEFQGAQNIQSKHWKLFASTELCWSVSIGEKNFGNKVPCN